MRLTLGPPPHLLDRPEAVDNMACVAPTVSSPSEAAYDASAAALAAFSEAMAIDPWDAAVHVLIVFPGLVATELLDAPSNEPVVGDIEPIPVDEVVVAVLSPLAGNTTQVYPTLIPSSRI